MLDRRLDWYPSAVLHCSALCRDPFANLEADDARSAW